MAYIDYEDDETCLPLEGTRRYHRLTRKSFNNIQAEKKTKLKKANNKVLYKPSMFN